MARLTVQDARTYKAVFENLGGAARIRGGDPSGPILHVRFDEDGFSYYASVWTVDQAQRVFADAQHRDYGEPKRWLTTSSDVWGR